MEVKVSVSNKLSKIEGLPSDISISLAQDFTFLVPNAYFIMKNTGWDGKVRFFNRPGNTFRTGLLPLILDKLSEYEVDYTVIDNREKGMEIHCIDEGTCVGEFKELFDYQVETINSIANNRVGGIPFYRGVLNIATNGGKTVIAEAIISQLFPLLNDNNRLVFVTHSLEIANQVKSSISKDLQIEVGFIGDSQWDEKPVTVAMIPSLFSKKKSKVAKEKKKFNKFILSVGAFIADEVHHAKSDTWYKVLDTMKNASIRLGLTGTINKNPIDEHKLYAVTGGVITKISNDYLIKQGYSARPTCVYIPVNEPDLDGLDYMDAYQDGIVQNEVRNKYIQNIVTTERQQGSSILILVERTEHGELLEELIGFLGVGEVQFTHGMKSMDFRKKVLERLKSGSLPILISTSILDEGVDVENINTIIYARGGKAPRRILQSIGRGLRKKEDGSGLLFYDFLDYTNEFLLEHTLVRYQTLKGEGFEINKMEM